MDNDELLSPFLPEVIKVRYLGDSYVNYEVGLADVDRTNENRAKAWLWGPPIVGLFLAFIALLIVNKNRKKSNPQRSCNISVLDSQDEVGDFDCAVGSLKQIARLEVAVNDAAIVSVP